MRSATRHMFCLAGVLWLCAGSPVSHAAEPQPAAGPLHRVSLRIDKMACSSCAARVEKVLQGIDGVKTARVAMKPPGAVIEYDPKKVTPERLVAAVEDAGFDASVAP